ncbi:torsin-1A-like [Physella acuta]|uniref:torsin-1A-like n=1 Tax=Physella acuta TaxID=109671 RepID=UPI0027DCC487|nr:torsin-1A-like [Physella acuta]XP_059177948.1 torsin-1A-like [Physella acuta]XP_059177949.1 torsin-1A-like [Physella acuta]
MEPMDLDSDGDTSYRHRGLRWYPEPTSPPDSKNNSNLSDMDVDINSPGYANQTSNTEADFLSSAMSSAMSLMQNNDVTVFQPQANTSSRSSRFGNSRSYSTPAIFKTEASTTAALASSAYDKVRKLGFGIPDSDSTFDHFPKEDSSHSSLRQRPVSTPSSTSLKDLTKKSNLQQSAQEHFVKQNKGSSCCKCVLLLQVVLILAVALVIWNSMDVQHDCQPNRYFKRKVLKMDLESNVFGQPIATKLIPVKIEEYLNKLDKYKNTTTEVTCKPLVLSFHGWTGVGKNYISKITADSVQSANILNLIVPYHFPHGALEAEYREQIHQWITSNSSKCAINVVVIDEMDKAFEGVVEGISSAIGALTQPCNTANATLIFLLSNSHAVEINQAFVKFSLEKPDRNREDFSMELASSLFTTSTKLWYTQLLEETLIDAFVPFLPLEKRHVVQCIMRDLVAKKFSTDSGSVDKILGELSFTEVERLVLSNTGCKRVADKVDLVMLGRHH